MRKSILAIALSTITFGVSFSQTTKGNIENDFSNYIHLIIDQNFEKSADYIMEEFFEVIPREQLITLMKQVYNNPSIEFHLENPKILEISNIENINNKHYAVLIYSNLMKMKFLSQNKEETEEDKKKRIDLTKTALFKKFGSDNVTYNEATDFFEVNVKKNVCAASKNGIDTWKFVTIEQEQKPILQKFIPKEILERI